MEIRKGSFCCADSHGDNRRSVYSSDLPTFNYIGQSPRQEPDVLGDILRQHDLQPDDYQHLRRISKFRFSEQ